MKMYREWASKVNYRKGKMLPLSSFENVIKLYDPGYESVYSFSEQDANSIKASESSKGMNKMAVGSDRLLIDIDKGEEGLIAVGKILEEKGYRFKLYSSGGKGYHIEMFHDFIYDARLPNSHKEFLKNLLGSAIDFIDPTLYQHGRLISLIGRVHPVTKKKKVFIREFPGSNVVIPIVDIKKEESSFQTKTEPLSEALLRAFDASMVTPSIGNRHLALWKVGKAFAEAGLSSATTLELLTEINESWETPKESKDVQAVVNSIYRK